MLWRQLIRTKTIFFCTLDTFVYERGVSVSNVIELRFDLDSNRSHIAVQVT